MIYFFKVENYMFSCGLKMSYKKSLFVFRLDVAESLCLLEFFFVENLDADCFFPFEDEFWCCKKFLVFVSFLITLSCFFSWYNDRVIFFQSRTSCFFYVDVSSIKELPKCSRNFEKVPHEDILFVDKFCDEYQFFFVSVPSPCSTNIRLWITIKVLVWGSRNDSKTI